MSFRSSVLFPAALAAVLASISAVPAWAQFRRSALQGGSPGVLGEIQNAGIGPLRVQICRNNGGRCVAETDVMLDGAFRIPAGSLETGMYEVRVTRAGNVVHSETQWLSDQGSSLLLRLPNQTTRSTSTEATVSAARLLNAPPPKAQKLYRKAAEAAAQGDDDATVKWLEKAIDVHPRFIEARNNLAVRFLKAGRMQDAVAQFEVVVELDPSSALGWSNLALALGRVGDAAAAERAARRAVEQQPQSTQAHYALALALLAQDKELARAAASFDRASPTFPVAQVMRAQALLGAGDIGGARLALTRFLSSTSGR